MEGQWAGSCWECVHRSLNKGVCKSRVSAGQSYCWSCSTGIKRNPIPITQKVQLVSSGVHYEHVNETTPESPWTPTERERGGGSAGREIQKG